MPGLFSYELINLEAIMLSNKNILIISSERWDHVFVSKHHYAVHLAGRGNTVYFLNPPGRSSGILQTQYARLFEVKYRGFPPGLRFYPDYVQKKVILRIFNEVERICSARFDVIWSFDSSVFFNLSGISPSVLKICHMVDVNQNFQIKKAASTADFCFCTSEAIRKKLIPYGRNVFKINHGFYIPKRAFGNKSFGGQQRIKAVYAGNLSIPYIDWPLLLDAVAGNPAIDFVFVGPDEGTSLIHAAILAAKKRVAEYSNAHFFGPVGVDELAEMYVQADLLLVAYQGDLFCEQVSNPHKMMDYIGSGKVIVATYTSEYKDFDPLIVMSNSNSGWIHRFSEVVARLDFYNSEQLQSRRKEFARTNSYESQIHKIEEIIRNR